MYQYVKERIMAYANYIIDNNSTIRKCASHFGRSKSSVHYELKYRLPQISLTKYLAVKAVLDKNFEEKHIRGGEATRQHFLKQKEIISIK